MSPVLDLSSGSESLCPRCRRRMVKLAAYSKALDSGVRDTSSNASLKPVDSGVAEFFWLDWFFGLFITLSLLGARALGSCLGPQWQRHRIRRLAHRFPRSPYCPGCGYLSRLI